MAWTVRNGGSSYTRWGKNPNFSYGLNFGNADRGCLYKPFKLLTNIKP